MYELLGGFSEALATVLYCLLQNAPRYTAVLDDLVRQLIFEFKRAAGITSSARQEEQENPAHQKPRQQQAPHQGLDASFFVDIMTKVAPVFCAVGCHRASNLATSAGGLRSGVEDFSDARFLTLSFTLYRMNQLLLSDLVLDRF